MKSLAKNSIFNIIYKISSILFPMITAMYVSRVLSTNGVGKVSYAQNIASYFVTLAAMGVPTYGIREIAKSREDKFLKNKTFTELFLINFATTILSTILYLSMVLSVPSFRNDIYLFIVCGLQIVLNCINIDWFYQGEEEYVYIACRSILVKSVSLILIVFFVHSREDYIYYAFISSIALAGNYVFNIIHAKKYVRLIFSNNMQIKKHMKPLVILALSIFLSSIYTKIDITMLGSMKSDTVAGLYTNASKSVELVITLCSAISAVFLPRLSFYYKSDSKEFYKLIDYGIKILCFLTIPATVGVFLLAPMLVAVLFGNDFMEAVVTVRIMSVLIVIKCFGNLLCYQLVIATGNERKRLPSYTLAAIMNILLNALLIPQYAQNGAAVASVVSELIVNGYQVVSMKRLLKFQIPFKPFVIAVFSTGIMAVSVFTISRNTMPIILNCLLSITGGIAVYGTINFLLKNEIMLQLVSKIKSILKKISFRNSVSLFI